METRALHIINGDELTQNMQALDLPGQQVIWREMLCEGRTLQEVGSPDFIKVRKDFLHQHYGIPSETYQEKFLDQLEVLQTARDFDQVVLWFEFDLFCHINMLAAIHFFLTHHQQVPIYLVCSRKLKGEKELQPLSQLNNKQLLNHYRHKISLDKTDLEIALLIWELYCSSNPIQLKQQIKTSSNFEYLSSCIRAHIERFPNSVTGINSLERNILKLIEKHEITSENQLLGYALQYQGYYGYSDIQMQRILWKIRGFFQLQGSRISLSIKGKQALEGTRSFYRELQNEDYYGGARVFDYLYDADSHRLLKL